MKNKKCGIVLPYFGKFGNYFQLFLNSCEKNTEFEWLIFTDDMSKYRYPENVKRIPFTLVQVKKLAEKKIGIKVSLESPYKLCDFKPTYGLIFEEYLTEYRYWGHCDCDLVFGDLNAFLEPMFEKQYDKIFASGHLTLYKNTKQNCRTFMKNYKGEAIYREALQNNRIFVFDEDCIGEMNPEGRNIHSIFIESGKKIYTKDLSFNVAVDCARFRKETYIPEKRRFEREIYKPRRYYWYNGKIISLEEKEGMLSKTEYLYIHLQKRYMRMNCEKDSKILEILPDRFKSIKKLPRNISELHRVTIGFMYLYWIDQYKDKIKRKLKKRKYKRKEKVKK